MTSPRLRALENNRKLLHAKWEVLYKACLKHGPTMVGLRATDVIHGHPS